MAVAVSALAICLFSLLSRNLWIPFRREKVSEAQFFFPKRKREFSFEHDAKRRKRKSAERGRGFKWGEPSSWRMGGNRLSRRRYSSRWSRGVVEDDTRRGRDSSSKAFGASIKRWVSEKCAQAERLTCWRTASRQALESALAGRLE